MIEVLSYLQDINKHKLTEHRLLENERFLKQVMELSPNIIYILDAKTKSSIYGNKTSWEMLGYTQEEAALLGMNFIPSVTHPEDMRTISRQSRRHQSMKDGEVVEFTTRVKDKDGNWRWLLSKEVVFKRDKDGAPSQILGASQDVSALKGC